MTWLGVLILVAAPPLYFFGLQMVCAPRSTSAVLARGLDSLGCFARDVVDYTTAFFAIGVTGISEKESEYERDCKKYADTLPAFSDETERIMRREGHWPEPRRDRAVFGYYGAVSGIWSESPHWGPKAPGLMRAWPKDYPPSAVKFQGTDTLSGEKPSEYVRRRYGQIASVKPNNETEAMRQMKALQDKVRRLNSVGVHIGYGSHPMDRREPQPSYATRIVREVVEVEEIEITSKSSAEVIVEGFERRYYEPIEEPDISRILLDG